MIRPMQRFRQKESGKRSSTQAEIQTTSLGGVMSMGSDAGTCTAKRIMGSDANSAK